MDRKYREEIPVDWGDVEMLGVNMEEKEMNMQRTVKASVWPGKEQSWVTQGISSHQVSSIKPLIYLESLVFIKPETYISGAIF